MLQGPRCKKERRVGTKLFLKAERCQGPKCGVVRNPVKPGYQATKKKRGRGLTEYGQILMEKQKVQWSYFIKHGYLKNLFKEAKKSRGITPLKLYNSLERRLDSVVYRAGFALGRAQAHQFASHGHFLLNGKKTTIPSAELRIGDVVTLNASSRTLSIFKDLKQQLKKYTPPEWLDLDKEDLSVKVVKEPESDPAKIPFNFTAVVEYLSR